MTAIKTLRAPATNHVIATVTSVAQGQATQLLLDNRHTVLVAGHAGNTPELSLGDQVIAQCINQQYYVLDRLRQPDETPFLNTRNQQLTLKVGKSSIQLDANGDLVLDAENIASLASELNEIKGKLLTLN